MTDEKSLEEKSEAEAIEPEVAETAVAETEKTEKKTEYKHSDYEYKSWSGGVPAPDGWERCPGYRDVIRRLKPAPPKLEDTTAETSTKTTSCQKKAEENVLTEPWGKPYGGCCC